MYRDDYKLYYVQHGDHLHSIAYKFNIHPNIIKTVNHIMNEDLTIGQSLQIPIRMNNSDLPVTAYILKSPVYLNYTNINDNPPYPLLNYQSSNSPYPMIYIPITELTKVGVQLNWDQQNKIPYLNSDYDELLDQIKQLRSETTALSIENWEVKLNTEYNKTQKETRYNGITKDGLYVFSGVFWRGATEVWKKLTVGKYYKYQTQGPSTRDFDMSDEQSSNTLIIYNDDNEVVTFYGIRE